MQYQEATREILWNVPALTNSIIMYAVLTLSLVVGGIGIFRRGELWLSGSKTGEYDGSLVDRFFDLFSDGLLQHRVNREKTPRTFHTLIYLGFLVLLFTTTMVFIDHDLGIRIYKGEFYLVVTLLSDLFGAGVFIGCAIAAHRRYLGENKSLTKSRSDGLFLGVITLLVIQGFVLEGLRIHATQDPWAIYSPIGLLFAKFFWGIPNSIAREIHFATWWFHTITVFACVAALPYSKFFHIFSASANLFFRRKVRPAGALPFSGDIEKLMEGSDEIKFGIENISDYNWKQRLDLDACTSCGRCQDVCPAYKTGKPLSPKWLILDTRNHMLGLHAEGKINSRSFLPKPAKELDQNLTKDLFLKRIGLEEKDGGLVYSEPTTRSENQLVQNAVGILARSETDRIAGDIINQDVFWSCTTCMACVEACPVGINQVDQIVENRRNMVLMHGEVPAEAQSTLRRIENQGNPFGDAADREKWFADLDITPLKPGDTVDYLYWVGCLSAFDPRKQKIARALVKIMKAAGLSFGVLGKAEKCTGDPARRIGDENLFQTLAKENIATLSSVNFSNLISNCPHCFNSLKNEYPQLGSIHGDNPAPRFIHHTVLIDELIRSGQIKLSKTNDQKYTFHDPCYLGRYNNEYEAPRRALASVPGVEIEEMEQSRSKGMCCGAGGGHYWYDMKVGERVNLVRIGQASKTGASKVATGCPFCLQMMEDGVKLSSKEGELSVQDIAEIVAEAL